MILVLSGTGCKVLLAVGFPLIHMQQRLRPTHQERLLASSKQSSMTKRQQVQLLCCTSHAGSYW